MLNLFICGAINQQQEVEEEQILYETCKSQCATPRKCRKSSRIDSKNPYSARGLDKFSQLLADLDKKRQAIYSQVGAQNISLIRFVYSTSNDVIPIVVKFKNRKNPKKQNKKTSKTKKPNHDHHETNNNKIESTERPTTKTTSSTTTTATPEPAAISIADNKNNKEVKQVVSEQNKNRRFFTWDYHAKYWRRPSCYVPVFFVLILLLLTVFGRSFAVFLTSVAWYSVPMLSKKHQTTTATTKTKNKEYVRRFSDTNSTMPRPQNREFKHQKSF